MYPSVRRVGLPGGIVLMPDLTVFEISADAWKLSQDSGCTCQVLDMSHIAIYEIALSNLDT